MSRPRNLHAAVPRLFTAVSVVAYNTVMDVMSLMSSSSGRAKRKAEPAAAPRALSELEFVGCEAFPMTAAEFDAYDGRLEVWDAETETAWVVCEGPGPAHESPAQGLAGLVERIAAVRGSPIRCYGAAGLMVRGEDGRARRFMQADQVVYLHPSRADLLVARSIVVGEHLLPDVVLEVDHTTDVRRGKLRLYESWGFPEVWVEVPEQRTPSRPRGRRSGLTIYRLAAGSYRESPASGAFPGWRASAIHTALNEAEPSGWTHADLERLGRALGEKEGTGPDDDPLLHSLREQSRAEGLSRGRAEGRSQGRAEGRAEAVRAVLQSRGIACSADLLAGIPDALSDGVVMAAALACDGERDFRARLRRPRSGNGSTSR